MKEVLLAAYTKVCCGTKSFRASGSRETVPFVTTAAQQLQRQAHSPPLFTSFASINVAAQSHTFLLTFVPSSIHSFTLSRYGTATWPHHDAIIRRLASLLVSYEKRTTDDTLAAWDSETDGECEKAQDCADDGEDTRGKTTRNGACPETVVSGEMYEESALTSESISMGNEVVGEGNAAVFGSETCWWSETLSASNETDLAEEQRKVDGIIQGEAVAAAKLEEHLGEMVKESRVKWTRFPKDKAEVDAERAFLSVWSSYKENCVKEDADGNLSDISVVRKDINLEENDDDEGKGKGECCK